MIHFNKRRMLALALALALLLSGCVGGSSSSEAESKAPLVTGDLDLPASSEPDATSLPETESSASTLTSSASSAETSSVQSQTAPPRTADNGKAIKLTQKEKAKLNAFINRSVAAFSSFEAADEIDDILVVSGMVLCAQEGKSRLLDDGTYGVEVEVFDSMVWDYFGRRITYPQRYEGEMGEVQYDGMYYRWYGGGFEPGTLTVESAEDLKNGYIKCKISGKAENEEGEEVEITGVCILLKTAQSPFGYYFIASKIEE